MDKKDNNFPCNKLSNDNNITLNNINEDIVYADDLEVELISKNILSKYIKAFEELAK
ncbi:hypothetical protein J2Z35_001930 [Acetoanaerobium pronyense]|uniref:Uncharacterized protein n=1 Tax=Acetoanaerobium pronyense TaxID=1482736 RepID=A0ABS4KLM9_9FIRM|nr:hypothetical protein [Acetoanaerobium pronyense]MBP2028131.1 hypothetical protein [Acetoanaerobium pronyense]